MLAASNGSEGKLKQTSIARNHPVLLLTLPPTLDAKLYQRHNKKFQAVICGKKYIFHSVVYLQVSVYICQFMWADMCI